jgi:hypothetical protein
MTESGDSVRLIRSIAALQSWRTIWMKLDEVWDKVPVPNSDGSI